MLFTAQIATNPETQAKSRSMFRYLVGTDESGVATDPKAIGVKAVPHDLDKARQLLKDAGWDPNRELAMVMPAGH